MARLVSRTSGIVMRSATVVFDAHAATDVFARGYLSGLPAVGTLAVAAPAQGHGFGKEKGTYFRAMIQESTEKIPAPPRMKDSKPAIYNKTTS